MPRTYSKRKAPLSYTSYKIAKAIDGTYAAQQAEARIAAANSVLTNINAQPVLPDGKKGYSMSESIRNRAMKTGRGLYHGRGGYFDDLEAIGDRFLRKGIPNIINAGNQVRNFLSGRGAYTTNQLISDGASIPLRPQQTIMDETGDIIISHREFVAAITPSSSGFQTQVFQSINPGLPGFAPWLSQIAQYYEEYEMIQCVYEFKSLVTEGNSTAAGEVIMATQYNPSNAAFISQANMENYDYADSCKMTDSMLHGVECDPVKHGGSATEYIRTGPVPSGQDVKTFDMAVFQLATVGSSSMTIGNLYVHYTIRLSKSKVLLKGAASVANMAQIYYNAAGSTVSGTGQFNRTNLFMTPQSTASLLNVGSFSSYDNTGQFYLWYVPTGTDSGNNYINFPQWVVTGSYLFVLKWTHAAGQVLLPTVTGTNCTIGTVSEEAPEVVTMTTSIVVFTVNVNAPGTAVANIRINSALPIGATQFIMMASQLDAGLSGQNF